MKKLAVAVLVVLVATSSVAEGPPQPRNIVEKALSWLGIRYRFAGNDEKRGVDCAGLVKRVFGDSGVRLPRTAAEQFRHGLEVALDDLQPGDLVFFRDTYKRGISHVGIYIGERRFVHAASTRRSVVVDKLDMPYYLTRFAGGRRIVEKKPAPAPEAEAQLAELLRNLPPALP